MRILVNLISGQILPNYRALIEFNPDRVVNLYTPESETRLQQINSMSNVESEDVLISGNDPQKVREICSDIHQRRISDEWVINVTGGTKPASFACLQYFAEQGVPVLQPAGWKIQPASNGRNPDPGNASQLSHHVPLEQTSHHPQRQD